MKKNFLFSTALVGATLAGLSPAFADFTPSEALERYIESAEAFGSTVTVDLKEEINGNVRWTGVVFTEEKSGSTSTIEWLEAVPVDDDTVKIILGSTIIVEAANPTDDGTMKLEMDLIDNQVILTEVGEQINASYSGEKMEMVSISNDPELPFTMNMSVEDIVAAYTFGDETRIEGMASTGPLSMSYGIEDEEMNFRSDTTFASSETSFDADIPEDGKYEGFLSGAQNAAISYSFNDMTTRTTFVGGPEGDGWINSTAALSAGTLTVQDGAFAMLGEAQDIAYSGQPPMPGIPEMSASMKSATLNMNMTVGKPGSTAPMAVAMTMEELELGETAWGMFDPTGAIPREPATLRLDLGADALWMLNDLETAAATGTPPFIPQSVVLRELFLTLGGASVSAKGEGMLSQQTGQPSGTAHIELKGVLTLVQTLSEIGLVPVPQAMMAQGMLPQFARPGPDGEDHFISEIEAMPDGSIHVNGMRVK